jgi:excisionase family DNA binding protein
MTIPASAEKLGSRLPSVDEKKVAVQLRKILASHMAGKTRLRVLLDDNKPADITLTPGLSALLMDLLRLVARGDAVTLVPVSQRLTTQQAADILNVSRPYLISIIEKGQIPCQKTGRHRRIKADDLFAYKKKRDESRTAALDALLEADAELL